MEIQNVHQNRKIAVVSVVNSSIINNISKFKNMKQITFLLFIALIAVSCGQSKTGSGNQEPTTAKVTDDVKVKVYYFHGKQRCRTCISIQEVAEQAVKQNFADNKEIRFVEIDFSDRANADLAEKYEITWSSLVVATENDHANITDQAFALVMSNPEALTELIVTETNKLLIQ
jgi:thiol-disulfide isomerase/thioredoxin